MYDVAIIGLGPAGATLARLLDKSLSVVAFDKKSEGAEGFKKPCGGLLAPDAQKSLAKFNLTLPLEVMVNPQIFAVRTLDVDSKLTRHYQRFYMNLDRHKFDIWLKSLVPEHVKIHNSSQCCKVRPLAQGGYEINWKEQGELQTVRARKVVGADGASSLLRRTIYPHKKLRSYLSIQQWFGVQHATAFYSCIFDKSATDCYCWGLSKDNYFIFGGAFAHKNAKEKFENLKKRLKPFGFQLDCPIKTEACLVLRPSGLKDFACGKDGTFLIGEAAGFISPSSLEGLSYAFDSACKLSQVLNSRKKNANWHYWLSTLGIRIKLFFKYLKAPFLYYAPLRYLIMRSGFRSIPVLRKPEDLGIDE